MITWLDTISDFLVVMAIGIGCWAAAKTSIVLLLIATTMAVIAAALKLIEIKRRRIK